MSEGSGYTYTTLSADRGEPVRVGVSFYLDPSSWVAVSGADDGRPRLSVTHGDVSASIGPADPGGEITAQDARIARHLAEKAAAYADAVERIAGQGEGGPAAA